MSQQALKAALGRPFDPTPPTSELAGYHAPYSRLTGDDVEGRLRAELRGFGRIGVTGVSGSGKSSLVRYVADGDETLAPIYLNVAAESHEKVRDPREFLDVLITHLADTARDVATLSDEQRVELLRDGTLSAPIPGVTRTTRAEFGGSWFLVAKLADDIATAVAPSEGYRNAEQLAGTANAALDHIRAYDLVPVLVCDDTDRILRLPNTDTRELFDGFFGEVLRTVVTQVMDLALVVAVHDDYRADEALGYDEKVTGLIERHIAIPRLSEPAHIEGVLDARAAFVPGDSPRPYSARDLFDRDAIAELAALHRGAHAHDLRHTLTTAKAAIALAADAADELVERRHVAAADAS